MVTGKQIIQEANKYMGVPYVFGAEAKVGEFPSALDCSELVELVCRTLGVKMPDGSEAQWQYCIKQGCALGDVEEGWKIEGALLFRLKGDGTRMEHVAFSDGKGNSIESRGSAYNASGKGTWRWPKRAGFTHAAVIPGVDYGLDVVEDTKANQENRKKIVNLLGQIYDLVPVAGMSNETVAHLNKFRNSEELKDVKRG